jgi:hypothetical protein
MADDIREDLIDSRAQLCLPLGIVFKKRLGSKSYKFLYQFRMLYITWYMQPECHCHDPTPILFHQEW